MTALEQKLLEQLEQEQKLNNTILIVLKDLFKKQNELIIENMQETKKLNERLEKVEEAIYDNIMTIDRLTTSLEELVNLVNTLNEELNE